MRTTFPEPITDFSRAADEAIGRAGGIDLARRVEENTTNAVRVRDVLHRLGMFEIDPRADLDQAMAAAELCRIAGSHALPYPTVGMLLRTVDDRPFALVDPRFPVIDHARQADLWRAATIDGRQFEAEPQAATGSNLAPFAMTVKLRALPSDAPLGDRQLCLVLGSFLLLGVGQRALELAIRHTRDREQFGRPLSDFQVIRHAIADTSVNLEGLALLCRYALWSLLEAPESSSDALAARLEAQSVVKQALRVTQQFHGASGLADEYDISVLVRHAQTALRLPEAATATLRQLRHSIERTGFAGPFAPSSGASTR